MKKEKKAKKEKKVKRFPAKKLPPLFKKKYTQQTLETKIIRKIYVPDDKTFVLSLFEKVTVQKKKKTLEMLAVPADRTFTKPELKRLKAIAKSIKKNKGRFKAAPFVAVAAVVAALCVSVALFKNIAAKMGITSALQGIFGARCDIASVNVDIFGARLTVRSLSQASASEPMENLFAFETLDVDFNLTQLLRGRFVAQNLEISAVAFGTKRTVSGELPPKIRKKIEKKKTQKVQKTQSSGESAFYASLEGKGRDSLSALASSLESSLDGYNPQHVLEQLKDSLKSEKKAKEVEEAVTALYEKWQDKPAELEKQVSAVQKTASSLSSLKPADVKTPAEIADAVKKIDAAIKQTKETKSVVEETVRAASADKDAVQRYSAELKAAVASDKALLASEVSKYTSLSLDDGKQLLTGAIDSAGYSLMGKYYPYLQKAVSYAAKMKKSSGKEKKAVKETKKKAASRRSPGRTVYWREDRMPALLIEHAAASGQGFAAEAQDITSDMDAIGRPLVARVSYVSGERKHQAQATVDARSASTEPLITAVYDGKRLPLALDMTAVTSAGGIPSLSGKTDAHVVLRATDDEAFTADAVFDVTPVAVTATPLSNERINALYQSSLAAVTSLQLKADAAFSEKDGVNLSLSSDADKKIRDAFSAALAKETQALRGELTSRLEDELTAKASGAFGKIDGFDSIVSQIKEQGLSADTANKLLADKKKELTGAATQKARQEAEKVKKQAEEKAKEAAQDAVKNAAKNALKGFKF